MKLLMKTHYEKTASKGYERKISTGVIAIMAGQTLKNLLR
tara:strand:+ start:323 stop:442 length:120 start_codon:yes stop_codon:yes gene_type:complete